MNQIISSGLLIIIGIITYILIIKITFKPKRFFMSDIINPKKKTGRILSFLEKKGWVQYISPTSVINEANKHGWNMTQRRYWTSFIIGTSVGMLSMGIYFNSVAFMIFGILGGIFYPHYELHKHKKKYREEISDKITIYLKSVANAMNTFNNSYDAIKYVLEDLEEPIYSDVELALIKLQDGQSTRESFEHFVDKYPYHEIRLFHETLDVISKSGTSNVEPLRKLAKKFKRKKYYRRRIQTESAQYMKNFRSLAFFVISLPFLFLFVSYDSYEVLVNNIIGQSVLVLSLVICGLTYYQVEKLSTYDPTEDKKDLKI